MVIGGASWDPCRHCMTEEGSRSEPDLNMGQKCQPHSLVRLVRTISSQVWKFSKDGDSLSSLQFLFWSMIALTVISFFFFLIKTKKPKLLSHWIFPQAHCLIFFCCTPPERAGLHLLSISKSCCIPKTRLFLAALCFPEKARSDTKDLSCPSGTTAQIPMSAQPQHGVPMSKLHSKALIHLSTAEYQQIPATHGSSSG